MFFQGTVRLMYAFQWGKRVLLSRWDVSTASLGIKMAQCHSWPNGVYVCGLGFGEWSQSRIGRREEKQECFLSAGSWRLSCSFWYFFFSSFWYSKKKSKSHFHFNHISKWKRAFHNLFESISENAMCDLCAYFKL